MTKEELAAKLDGCEYGEEGSKELWAEAKAAGLVVVFGASDDLMEFRGAENDEIGAYDGGIAYFTSAGLVAQTCDNDACPHEAAIRKGAAEIEAFWDAGNGFSWQYETVIPHAKFIVKEGDELYCEGIVFALSDVPA